MSQIGSGRVRDPASRVRSDQKKWFAAHSVLRLHLDTDPFPSLVENHRTVERKILAISLSLAFLLQRLKVTLSCSCIHITTYNPHMFYITSSSLMMTVHDNFRTSLH